MKRAVLLGVACLVLAVGCGGGGNTTAPATTPTTATSTCADGEIRILQGQPTDLPGGGSAGIGQVSRSDPATVRLVLGGADPGETASGLAVGDTFTVRGATYEVTCISPGKVTARQAS